FCLGDPDFVQIPQKVLTSKDYAQGLRATIHPEKATPSDLLSGNPTPLEDDETTHFSIIDRDGNRVGATQTVNLLYGSGLIPKGTGFLLNNEMGDFNARPGLTNAAGLIGTDPNLARPGKRMLSSMSPTIVSKDGKLVMVTGTPGGRTIINTVLMTILNVVDFGMNAQEAVDAGRIHHQWLPDRITFEEFGFSADTVAALKAMGHTLQQGGSQGVAQVIVYNAQDDMLEGGLDRRAADGGVGGK
ncbi:MAG: gamma-glutamyltransferase, partial [Vicinamibacterales bacterium]